ncbi:hypothetical protein LTR85_011331 [Meristemomyces frigidus]|nr:hypothetical protein LTR85_011331 [Meristemomyces frigidus]
MGPAFQAVIPPNVCAERLPAALQAFPSPASTTDSLESPTLSKALAGTQLTPQWTPQSLLPESADVLTTQPGDVSIEPVLTPPPIDAPQPDMNTIVGGALAPVHTIPPRRPRQRTGHGLRLPSFEALGIAAPHPDRFGHQSLDGALSDSSRETTRLYPREDVDLFGVLSRLGGGGGGGQLDPSIDSEPLKAGGGRAIQSPVHHYVTMLTPPAESGDHLWNSMATVSSAPMDSPATDPGHVAPSAASAQASPGASASGTEPLITVDSDAVDEANGWVEGAVQALLENLQSAPQLNNPVRVLSHALPSPSPTGHIFPTVVGTIHNSTPSSPTVWINVFHAIPGRFNLADLPTSPPSTPGPPIGGDDYFTQKIFDSAVPISDYQEDLSKLPRSPHPIVPPSSINISVVERYIPPTSMNEYADMFSTNGPSILVDRMVELSPNNGSLVFIYPTKTGAQTFMRDYLGPILDPLLRSMCVVHGLSSDLSRTLGNMTAIDRLLEYEQLEHQIARLCAKLTQRSTSMQRLHGHRSHFSVVYSSKKEVPLSRDVWARDWWTKQEKPRVRDVITRYAHEAQKKSSNEYVDRPATPAELIQHLLDGVIKKPYHAGQEPSTGIEVSVFVIKRSE